VRIGRAGAVQEPELERAAAAAGHPEVEPLVEIGLVIANDFEVESVAIHGDQANVAAINGARH
jgi:hypothetical protein